VNLRVLTLEVPSLKDLNLCWSGLITLSLNCPNLKTVDFSGCVIQEDSLIRCMQDSGKLLKNLWAISCSGVTEDFLRAVSEYCISLKILNVSNCNKATKSGILSVAQQCKRLRRIYMNNVNNETLNDTVAQEIQVDFPLIVITQRSK